MTAYYNEIDPYAASWLCNLIDAGHIAPGVVDTRSIEDIAPRDLDGFTQCHFFAGIGVWSYALRRAGGDAINAEAARVFIEAAAEHLSGSGNAGCDE